jgi:hypothetical protein
MAVLTRPRASAAISVVERLLHVMGEITICMSSTEISSQPMKFCGSGYNSRIRIRGEDNERVYDGKIQER